MARFSNSSAARMTGAQGASSDRAVRNSCFGEPHSGLIYAWPGQSLAAWRDELDEALALTGEHLSLYQLTIEPGTAFTHRAAKGELVLPDMTRPPRRCSS